MNDRKDDTIQSQTSAIQRLVLTTRRWLRSTWVATGLAVSLGIFITVFLGVVLLDLATPLWPILRFIALMLVVLPTVWAAWVGVIRPLFRRMTRVMVARRIEQELPNIHNRIVTCVSLDRQAELQASRSFHHRLVSEAYQRVREFRLSRVLDLLNLRRASLFALLCLAGFITAFVLFSDRLPTAAARILQPFADIPPISDVLYVSVIGNQTEPGDTEVLRGEDITFTVSILKGEPDDPGTPEALRIDLTTVDDAGTRKRLIYGLPEFSDGQATLTLTGMQDSFTYRVRGGGTWTRQANVLMLDRPRIEGLQTALFYPDYMRLPEPIMGPPDSPDVAGPKGSTVQVTVKISGDASEGEIELLQQQVTTVDVTDRRERLWFSHEMPMGARKRGDWKLDTTDASQQGHADNPRDGAHAHGFENARTPFELSPGESIYAYVRLDPDAIPESLMLKFHDGKNWEHRAFWGADKISEGTLDTPSRRHLGELPEAGSIVRLEVPASAIEMNGSSIHGISFALFGGHAVWYGVGTMPPATQRITKLVPTESYLLNEVNLPEDDPPTSSTPVIGSRPTLTSWSGTVPLERDGFYRVVLRNRLGYENRKMDEGELTALPDNPPQMVIERPAKDLVVSEPVKVPIHISAYDDYGLDDVVLALQFPGEASFSGRSIRHYEVPVRDDNFVAIVDLAAEGLEINQTLRYRIEVRDTKGQSVMTEDRTIRIANDNNAADRKLDQYQEKTETVQEKLEQLVKDQASVEATAEELAERFEELTEAIEEAQAEAKAENEAAADEAEANNQPPPEPDPIELDEQTAEQLKELQAELAEVAQAEAKAEELSKQVENELQQLADQSADLELLPPEIAEQVQGIAEAFEELAVEPIEELQDLLTDAAAPTSTDPQLPQIEAQAEDVQQSLEDIQDRLEAIADAQETSRTDAQQAVDELQQDVMQQNAEITARELTELRDAVAEMREELGELAETQDALMADAEQDLSDPLFEKLTEAQDELQAEAEPVLDDASDLLQGEMLEQVRNEAAEPEPAPEFQPALADPDAADGEPADGEPADGEPADGEPADGEPADGEPADGEPADGEPADGEPADGEPADGEPADGEPADGEPADGEPADGEPADGEPADGEPADGEPADGEPADGEPAPGETPSPSPQQEALQANQSQLAEQLASAEEALAADQEILESLIEDLSEQLPEDALGEMSPEQAEQLQELLSAETTQEALEMFQRLEQMMSQSNQPTPPGNQPPPPGETVPPPDLTEIGAVDAILLELDDFDLNARAVIMKMQPREREDLIQGLKEDGPEGYRHFIRDYFRKLTKVQAEK